MQDGVVTDWAPRRHGDDDDGFVPDRQLLDRPLYGFGQVDRLLGLHGGTTARWLEGYRRLGTQYMPIIRPEPTGAEVVSWGEFVEAAFMAAYREHKIATAVIRSTVAELRDLTGERYPLAMYRPLVSGQELLIEADERARRGLSGRPADVPGNEPGSARQLLNPKSRQAVLSAAVALAQRVEFDEAGVFARRYFPWQDREVAMQPDLAFGRPTVGSVRADIVAEDVAAGESEESVAHLYGLTLLQVRSAVQWERSLGHLRAA